VDDLSRDEIEYALKVARARGFNSVKLKLGETSFSATLGEAEIDESPEFAGVASQPKSATVKSPSVGYFRPGRTVVEVGQLVSAGDLMGEIVALGIANDVTAPSAGKVSEKLVSDGDAVEFGQALFTLETE